MEKTNRSDCIFLFIFYCCIFWLKRTKTIFDGNAARPGVMFPIGSGAGVEGRKIAFDSKLVLESLSSSRAWVWKSLTEWILDPFSPSSCQASRWLVEHLYILDEVWVRLFANHKLFRISKKGLCVAGRANHRPAYMLVCITDQNTFGNI